MQRIGNLHSHSLETGCYVDGHHGWRAMAYFVEKFDGVLYTLTDNERQTIADFYANSEGTADIPDALEAMVSLADDAENVISQALSADICGEWHDGEFYISPYDPEEDDDQ